MRLIPGPLRGAFSLLLFALNTIFWVLPLLVFHLVKIAGRGDKWRGFWSRVQDGIGTAWISFNNLNLRITNPSRWDVELPDGRFVLPYTGYKFPHKYPRGDWRFWPGYAVWPKGRLVALEAESRGQFTAVAFMPPGRKLRINAQTHRAGSVLVEVVSLADQKALPGRAFTDAAPIVGDHHWTPVTWDGKDDLGHKDSAAVLLRFRMDKARIYGLEFE